MTVDLQRELLRHLLATLEFRGGLAITDAPEDFTSFRAGATTRSAGEILAHIGDLIEGSLYLMKGEFVYLETPPQAWADDVKRFFAAITAFDLYLVSDAPLMQPLEKIVQGPLADALTHVGQIVLLRRLAGKPIAAESYFAAEIKAGAVQEKYFSQFI